MLKVLKLLSPSWAIGLHVMSPNVSLHLGVLLPFLKFHIHEDLTEFCWENTTNGNIEQNFLTQEANSKQFSFQEKQ